MSLLDRHVAFVAALRDAGLPVSLAEGIDASHATAEIGLGERELLRQAYAATLVKRQGHREAFDQVFDLYFPALVGETGASGHPDDEPDTAAISVLGDGPEDLALFREQLSEALLLGDQQMLADMAREAVGRFGQIRGRGPGEQRWSAYNVGQRVAPQELVDKVMAALGEDMDDDPAMRRTVSKQVERFEAAVVSEVSRRAAEVRGPEYVARHSVRETIEQLDFTAARKADLEQMRLQLQPLARRLAVRMNRHKSARRRGPVDFRHTMRASMSTGGVPVDLRYRPRHPGRTDLVVLCDVSGSVANFANFTLMLVFALREQFSRVRAFTFVDEVHEVSDSFDPRRDPAEVLTELAASARFASMWGRTNYGRAFTRFTERFPGVLNPRTNLLILGDARSNYADLSLPVLREMAHEARHSWWLNPEHERNWDTGDSAASAYGEVVPMLECRNLVQLEEFVTHLG